MSKQKDLNITLRELVKRIPHKLEIRLKRLEKKLKEKK